MPSFLRRKALASIFCCTVILSTQYVFHIHGASRTIIGQKRSLFSGAEDDIVDVSSSVEKVEQAATKGTDLYRRIAIVQYTDNLNGELPGFVLARDAMRAGLGRGGPRIVLIEGDHHLLEPVLLDSRDEATRSEQHEYSISIQPPFF